MSPQRVHTGPCPKLTASPLPVALVVSGSEDIHMPERCEIGSKSFHCDLFVGSVFPLFGLALVECIHCRVKPVIRTHILTSLRWEPKPQAGP